MKEYMELHAKEKRAVIISTGKEVVVYKSSLRPTWIDSSDMQTEYEMSQDKRELRFI